MTRQTTAYLFALGAVLFWSTAASAFKITLAYLTPLGMLVWSSLTSLLFLLGAAAVTGRIAGITGASLRVHVLSALTGLLNPFLYYVILFKAYSLLSAQEALTLNYTWPVMIVLLSIPFLGQRLNAGTAVALGISFAGVFVIAVRGDVRSFRFTDPAGVMLAIASALVWGVYWLLNVRDTRDGVVKLAHGFMFGTAAIVLAAAVTGELTVPPAAGFAGAVYIGLFEMGVTFALWIAALSRAATTASVSNLVYISPFLSLVWIHLLVGEPIALSTVAGLMLIIAGIAIQRRSSTRHPQP